MDIVMLWKNKILCMTCLCLMCLIFVKMPVFAAESNGSYEYSVVYYLEGSKSSSFDYACYSYAFTSEYPIYAFVDSVYSPDSETEWKEVRVLGVNPDMDAGKMMTKSVDVSSFIFLNNGHDNYDCNTQVLKQVIGYANAQTVIDNLTSNNLVNTFMYRISSITTIPDLFYTKLEEAGKNPEQLVWNIPLFESKDALIAYLQTGDDSGQINKPAEPTVTYVDDFSLTGFTCNNSISATWAGIASSDSLVFDDIYIEVIPSYFLILEAGEEEQDYETVGIMEVPFTDYSFSRNYNDFFINNPYVGRCQLLLSFRPCRFSAKNNEIIKGKSVMVKFNESGKITNLDIPEGSLTPIFDDSISFKNFMATNEFPAFGDFYVHCFWQGVNVREDIDYVYSDVKIQLYASSENANQASAQWIDFECDDIISFNTNRLSFNLNDLHFYCKKKGFSFGVKDSAGVYDNKKIRLTPYCKTETEYFYGKSVEIIMNSNGRINKILQSTGDAIGAISSDYTDLESDYISDGTFIEDIMDDIFGENGSEMDLNNIATNFFQTISSFLKACGQFPAIVTNILGFLPEYYKSMLVIALGCVIVLRVLGR